MKFESGLIAVMIFLITAVIAMILVSGDESQQIMCTKEYNPVCGEDSKTYSNRCMLNAANVEIKYEGVCKIESEPKIEQKIELGETPKITESQTQTEDIKDEEPMLELEPVSIPEPAIEENTETELPQFAEVTLAIGSGVPGCEDTNECYIPYEVTIGIGGEVLWINDDAGHTVTAGDVEQDRDLVGVDYPNGFDSGFFTAGNNFSHKFQVAGDYPYFCQVHPWMKGIVLVK